MSIALNLQYYINIIVNIDILTSDHFKIILRFTSDMFCAREYFIKNGGLQSYEH